MHQLYLTANYPLQQFQLAPAVTEAAGAVDLRPFENANSLTCEDSPRDKAYIGVIVLGCVIGLILIIFCIWLFRRLTQTRATEKVEPKGPADDSEQGSRAPLAGETPAAAIAGNELEAKSQLEGRSVRLDSLVSVSTEDAPEHRKDGRLSITTIMSHQPPEPTRYPNIFPPFPNTNTVHEAAEPEPKVPELDHGVQKHELAGGNHERDMSPLSDRGPG